MRSQNNQWEPQCSVAVQFGFERRHLVPKDAPRGYIYEKADQLVKWQDMEAHAMKAS